MARLAIIFLFWFGSIAHGANITKISATGRTAISNDMTQKARRHALEDALYMAALKAGADISSTAITNQGILVRDIVKLDTKGRLVDFAIVGEKNTGTHYEVELNAFFAQKSDDFCPKPRFPSVSVMFPNIQISQTVDFRYHDFASLISTQIKENFESKYPGPVLEAPQVKLESIQRTASKNLLFDYNSIQSGNLSKPIVDGDYIVNISIQMRMDGISIKNQVQIDVLNQRDFMPFLSLDQEFVTNLPLKTPLRALNVLWPKWLNIEQNKINQLTDTVSQKLIGIACRQLEAKIMLVGDKLKLGIGSTAGVKNGSLAYVTQGKESWTLLEVTAVDEISSTLRPINTIGSNKKLVNQKIRFIEGALQ